MAIEMTLREKILMRLVEVIDPETGEDVLRMQLVSNLDADEETGLFHIVSDLHLRCVQLRTAWPWI